MQKIFNQSEMLYLDSYYSVWKDIYTPFRFEQSKIIGNRYKLKKVEFMNINYALQLADKLMSPPNNFKAELDDVIQAHADECLLKGSVMAFGDEITIVHAYRELEGKDESAVLKMRNPETYQQGLDELNQMLFESACWLIELARLEQQDLAA